MEVPQPLLSIVTQALTEGATDIHVDVAADTGIVRFRVDGIIQPKERLTPGQAGTIINQVRVAGRMDIDVAFRPLEGHFAVEVGGRLRSVRATIVPIGPERRAAHLRILTSEEQWRSLTQLGLAEEDRERVESVVEKLCGLILVAGPTGAGKTTTLYALASRCDPERCVVASIEDPVEFDVPFMRQLEVDEEHQVDMAQGLHSLLRMDADVLVIGEIRDRESAQIAGHAALAGRLVLATVHGRNAATAVEAMHHLGVPFYALGGSLRLVMAQRLIRCVCGACAESRPIDSEERELLEQAGIDVPPMVKQARGCDVCHGYGYRGRTAIFEVVPVDEELGRWLTRGPDPAGLGTRFREAAARTLPQSALQCASAGVTTMAEVMPLFGAAIDQPQ